MSATAAAETVAMATFTSSDHLPLQETYIRLCVYSTHMNSLYHNRFDEAIDAIGAGAHP